MCVCVCITFTVGRKWSIAGMGGGITVYAPNREIVHVGSLIECVVGGSCKVP